MKGKSKNLTNLHKWKSSSFSFIFWIGFSSDSRRGHHQDFWFLKYISIYLSIHLTICIIYTEKRKSYFASDT